MNAMAGWVPGSCSRFWLQRGEHSGSGTRLLGFESCFYHCLGVPPRASCPQSLPVRVHQPPHRVITRGRNAMMRVKPLERAWHAALTAQGLGATRALSSEWQTQWNHDMCLCSGYHWHEKTKLKVIVGDSANVWKYRLQRIHEEGWAKCGLPSFHFVNKM